MDEDDLKAIRAAIDAPAGRDYDVRCENGSCHKASRLAEHVEELVEDAERQYRREALCREYAASLMYFHDRFVIAVVPADTDFKPSKRGNTNTHGVLITAGETPDVALMYMTEGRGAFATLAEISSVGYLPAVMRAADAFISSVRLWP